MKKTITTIFVFVSFYLSGQYAYFNTDNIDLDKETGFYDVEKSFLM